MFNDRRIFENNNEKPLIGPDNHMFCECKYVDVQQKSIGSISGKGILSPDVYLSAYNKLLHHERRSNGFRMAARKKRGRIYYLLFFCYASIFLGSKKRKNEF